MFGFEAMRAKGESSSEMEEKVKENTGGVLLNFVI